MKTFQPFLSILALISLLLTACQPAPPNYAEQYGPLLEKDREAWNTGNLDLLDSVYAADVVRMAGIKEINGLDAVKEEIRQTRENFPELALTLEDAIYTADKIVARWTATGKIGTTDLAFKVPSIGIAEVKDGRIVREWSTVDGVDEYLRLGFQLAPPGATVTMPSDTAAVQ